MANYNLVVNSNFRPFSYQEYIAPLATLQEQHNLIEDQLAELDAKASIFEGLANNAKDSDAYNQYKQFANELERQRDLLSNEGLKSNTRGNLMKMKSRYAKEIVPIEQAYNRRLAQIEEQRQALLKDNSLLFSYDAANKGLNDYLKDQALSYTPVSGRQLEDEVGNVITNYSKAAIESNEGKEILKRILPAQYEKIQQLGFSPEAITNAILNSNDSDKILRGIVDSVVYTSGIQSWNDSDKLEKAYQWARRGLSKGIGESRSQIITDQVALENLRHQHALDEINHKDRNTNNISDEDNPFDSSNLNPVPIIEQDLNSELGNDYTLAKNVLNDYFTTDELGNIKLNDKGKKEYHDKKMVTISSNTTGTYNQYTMTDSKFKKLMDKLTTINGRQLPQSEWGKALKKYVENKTDALENTVYRINFDSTTRSNLAEAMELYNADHELNSFKYESKVGKYINEGKLKLYNKGKNSVAGEFSDRGNYLVVTSSPSDSKNSEKRTVIGRVNLKEINPNADAKINSLVNSAKYYEEEYNKYPEKLYKIDGLPPLNGNQLKNYFLNKAQDNFVKAAKAWKAENNTR